MYKIRVVNITFISLSLLMVMWWNVGGMKALTNTPTPSTTPTTTPTLTPTRANAASSGSLKFDENLPDLAIVDVRLVADMRYANWCAMTKGRYLIVEIAASKPIPFFMLKVNQTEVLIRDYLYRDQPRWYWFSDSTVGEAGEIQVVLDSQNDVAEMDEGNNAVTVRVSDLQAGFEAMPQCPVTATATTTYTPGPSPTTTPGPSPSPTPT